MEGIGSKLNFDGVVLLACSKDRYLTLGEIKSKIGWLTGHEGYKLEVYCSWIEKVVWDFSRWNYLLPFQNEQKDITYILFGEGVTKRKEAFGRLVDKLEQGKI